MYRWIAPYYTDSGTGSLGWGFSIYPFKAIRSDPLQMILESDFHKHCSGERILGLEIEKGALNSDGANF